MVGMLNSGKLRGRARGRDKEHKLVFQLCGLKNIASRGMGLSDQPSDLYSLEAQRLGGGGKHRFFGAVYISAKPCIVTYN